LWRREGVAELRSCEVSHRGREDGLVEAKAFCEEYGWVVANKELVDQNVKEGMEKANTSEVMEEKVGIIPGEGNEEKAVIIGDLGQGGKANDSVGIEILNSEDSEDEKGIVGEAVKVGTRRKITGEDARKIKVGGLSSVEVYIGRGHSAFGLPRSKWASPFPIGCECLDI
jgi:hypothetical protein